MNDKFQEAIEILEAEVEPTQRPTTAPTMANRVSTQSPADKLRIHALAAREMFAGRTDAEVAGATGKSVKTIQRLRKNEQFMAYYTAYVEKITKNVDRAIQAKLMNVLPARFDRMIELSKQDVSKQVAFQATKWMLEASGAISTVKEKLNVAGAIEAPKEVRDVLQAKGKAALSLPEKIKAAKRCIASGESNVVQRSSKDNGNPIHPSANSGTTGTEKSS